MHLQTELQLPVSQTLALFVKSLRKIYSRLEELRKAAASAEILPPDTGKEVEGDASWMPLKRNLDEELAEAGNEEQQRLRERQREMIDSLDLSKYVYYCSFTFGTYVLINEIIRRYAIDDSSSNWEEAQRQIARNAGVKGKLDVVSVRSGVQPGVKRKSDDDNANRPLVNSTDKKMHNKKRKQ